MIHALFLNGYLIDCKDTRAYLASEYLEEWNGVLDATEVGWDLDPPPPDCGVLVDLGRGNTFGDIRVCSMVRSCRLATDCRMHILQGKGWSKDERKYLKMSRTGRWVSQEAAFAAWLTIPVIRSTDA